MVANFQSLSWSLDSRIPGGLPNTTLIPHCSSLFKSSLSHSPIKGTLPVSPLEDLDLGVAMGAHSLGTSLLTAWFIVKTGSRKPRAMDLWGAKRKGTCGWTGEKAPRGDGHRAIPSCCIGCKLHNSKGEYSWSQRFVHSNNLPTSASEVPCQGALFLFAHSCGMG